MTRLAERHDLALTSFVGRGDDLAEGRRLLGAARLVTLVGPGGVGKTRLARRLADQAARAFPDGTFVVELAEVHDADALAAELAGVLGLEGFSHAPEVAIAEFVGQRRLLLVMDNCEHLVADCAALLRLLLERSPSLRVLATSRQPMGVAGEQLMTVQPLSLPSPGAVRRDGLTDSEAVELFVERARLVVPGFELTADNVELVARLCTVLDGMPLAIELAAARLRMLSLEQLVQRLRDRFGVLAVAATAGLPRHQTLRGSVDWSFDLCSTDEQTVWARMSIFEGGADLEAVEAVCASPGLSVFDAVAGLVDKSVLVPQEVAGRVRYRMLEMIRDYGRDRLAEGGETQLMSERHRVYFVAFGRAIEMSSFGPRQRDRFARVEAELPNLRVAHQACLASPDTHIDAVVLASSLWWHWVGGGGPEEGSRLFERSLSGTPQPAPETLRALIRASWLAVLRSDREAARTYAEKALAMTVHIEPELVGHSARAAGALLAFIGGDLDLAIDVDRRSLGEAVHPGMDEAEAAVVVLLRTSMLQAWSGRPAEALHDIDRALKLCEEHGEEWWRSYLLCLKGACLAGLGRYQEALDAAQQALRLARGFHALSVVTALELTAQVSAALDDGTRAAVLLGAVSAIWPGIGTSMFREDQSRHAATERRVRDRLGDTAYAAAYERGRGLGADKAVSFALGERQPAASVQPVARGEANAHLTARELEVAEMIARGLSNKEMAEKLVISPRTAEGHVARLLDKLGFESRARVAAWVAERHARSGNLSDRTSLPT